MPAKGYTWKTAPDLNRRIRDEYQTVALPEVRASLNQSFSQVQAIIGKHSDEDLFEKRKYKWTGTTSLGAYLISATSSHYEWAYALIKKCKRA